MQHLARVRFAGFSLPFYFGAQGAILIYLALIVVYILSMQRADRRLQRAFDADAKAAVRSAPGAGDASDAVRAAARQSLTTQPTAAADSRARGT